MEVDDGWSEEPSIDIKGSLLQFIGHRTVILNGFTNVLQNNILMFKEPGVYINSSGVAHYV